MRGFVGLIRMGFQGVRDPTVQLAKLLPEFLDFCVVCFCRYVARQFIRRFARKTAFPAISFPSGRFRSPSKTHSGGIPNRFLQVAVSKTLRQSRVAPTIKPHLPERFRYSPRTSCALRLQRAQNWLYEVVFG